MKKKLNTRYNDTTKEKETAEQPLMVVVRSKVPVATLSL